MPPRSYSKVSRPRMSSLRAERVRQAMAQYTPANVILFRYAMPHLQYLCVMARGPSHAQDFWFYLRGTLAECQHLDDRRSYPHEMWHLGVAIDLDTGQEHLRSFPLEGRTRPLDALPQKALY